MHKYDDESTNKTANKRTAGSDGAMELKWITILLKPAVDSMIWSEILFCPDEKINIYSACVYLRGLNKVVKAQRRCVKASFTVNELPISPVASPPPLLLH